jgi:glycine dehydrogenase
MNAPSRIEFDDSATKFEQRHIGLSSRDVETMLHTVGVASMDELIEQTVPASIRRAAVGT